MEQRGFDVRPPSLIIQNFRPELHENTEWTTSFNILSLEIGSSLNMGRVGQLSEN